MCKIHGEFEQVARTHLYGSGCQKCGHMGYSKECIKWLNSIAEKEHHKIMHAENGGEYNIPNTPYLVDGFCRETNTIYEFHGCYWHGCLCQGDRNKLNSKAHATMEE